jgi:Right handed beta helix region
LKPNASQRATVEVRRYADDTPAVFYGPQWQVKRRHFLSVLFNAAVALIADFGLFCTRATAQEKAPAADVFVATNGNDGWSGTLPEPNTTRTDGPVASIQRARDVVRDRKATERDRSRPYLVHLRGGIYYLSEPLRLSPADSGSANAPIVYAAFPGERPVLSGGSLLTGWKVSSTGQWELDIPEVKSGAWKFSQLFVNDQRRFRPRLPKTGYFNFGHEVPPSNAAKNSGYDRFTYLDEDLHADWKNLNDVEITAFHEWTTSTFRVAALDETKRTVTTLGHTYTTQPWGKFRAGYRYRVENVSEALTEAGEWYLDQQSGDITYLAEPGERIDNTTIIAPRLEHLLILTNSGSNGEPVCYIRFEGLTFAHTSWLLPKMGISTGQAAMGVSAAIVAVGTQHVTFDHIAVRNTGGYAIALGPGSEFNSIINSEFVDLGAGGITVGQIITSQTDPDDLKAVGSTEVGNNKIDNNLIASGGRIHPSAAGIWIGQSANNIVSNMDIHDFYYTGISVGWTWGYGSTACRHNVVSRNLIYDIGQGVLSDMGGIYTLGVGTGTTVSENVIHDVTGYSYGGYGLYADEGSSEIAFAKNLVYRTSHGGFFFNYGKHDIVRDNIFAFGRDHQLGFERPENHHSLTFERNIIFWNGNGNLLFGKWVDAQITMDKNIYWNAASKSVVFSDGEPMPEWQKRFHHDINSIVADPQFVDADRGKCELLPSSPAWRLGFQQFDHAKAGRRTKPDLTMSLPWVPRAFD